MVKNIWVTEIQTCIVNRRIKNFSKNLSAGKPDSVVGYHLSCCNITVTILLPTLPAITPGGDLERAAQYPARKLTRRQDVHGITAHKVYPLAVLLQPAVSSYLTFSLLPAVEGFIPPHGGIQETIFCGTVFPVKPEPAINRCVALCCPDFPSLP